MSAKSTPSKTCRCPEDGEPLNVSEEFKTEYLGKYKLIKDALNRMEKTLEDLERGSSIDLAFKGNQSFFELSDKTIAFGSVLFCETFHKKEAGRLDYGITDIENLTIDLGGYLCSHEYEKLVEKSGLSVSSMDIYQEVERGA